MKKIMSVMTIGLLATTNVASSSSNEVLSKSDSTMLFGQDISRVVVELKENEMRKTEGKAWDNNYFSYISSNYTSIIYSLSIGDTTSINNIQNVIAPTVVIAPTLIYNRYSGN